MVRPTDQEATGIEEIVYYSQVLREGGMPHFTGPHGEGPG